MQKFENRSDFDEKMCNQKKKYVTISKITTRTSITLNNMIFMKINKKCRKSKCSKMFRTIFFTFPIILASQNHPRYSKYLIVLYKIKFWTKKSSSSSSSSVWRYGTIPACGAARLITSCRAAVCLPGRPATRLLASEPRQKPIPGRTALPTPQRRLRDFSFFFIFLEKNLKNM